MAEPKTKPNEASVDEFIGSVRDDAKREDSARILEMMREATGEEPRMWGSSIVGFGQYRYRYASGREGDWMRIGFSPRKQSMTIYIMDGLGKYGDLLSRLGNHKTGKSCLYIKGLADVDEALLRELIAASLSHFEKKYGK